MAVSNQLQGHPDGAKLRKGAGEYVKGLREKAKMTQQELAKALGMDYYTTISQIERGISRVPPDTMENMAKALGVPPQDFVKRLMSYYDPYSWQILFGNQKTQ